MGIRIAVQRAPRDRSHAEQKQCALETYANPFLTQEIVVTISKNFDHICSHILGIRPQVPTRAGSIKFTPKFLSLRSDADGLRFPPAAIQHPEEHRARDV